MFAVLGGFGVSALLGFGVAYMYIVLSLGEDMTPWRMAALVVAGLAALAGFFFFITRRKQVGAALWAVAVLALVGLSLSATAQYKMENGRRDTVHIRENEKLVAEALTRVPCANGDTALLLMRNNDHTGRSIVSLYIVPADQTMPAHILVSTSGQYKPPTNERIWEYLTWSKTTCSNSEFESLHAMMDFVTRHYETQKAKYAK